MVVVEIQFQKFLGVEEDYKRCFSGLPHYYFGKLKILFHMLVYLLHLEGESVEVYLQVVKVFLEKVEVFLEQVEVYQMLED
jgi:hypothetical protein